MVTLCKVTSVLTFFVLFGYVQAYGNGDVILVSELDFASAGLTGTLAWGYSGNSTIIKRYADHAAVTVSQDNGFYTSGNIGTHAKEGYLEMVAQQQHQMLKNLLECRFSFLEFTRV